MISWRGPGIPITGFPQECPRKSQILASARNRAICGRGGSQSQAPAGRRNWSISGPRFRREPSLKHAAGSPGNAPPEPYRPYEFPRRPRNPRFLISPSMSPEIADLRVGPKSGDLCAGRLPNVGPRRSAQFVNFRTPFSPETPTETRDGAGFQLLKARVARISGAARLWRKSRLPPPATPRRHPLAPTCAPNPVLVQVTANKGRQGPQPPQTRFWRHEHLLTPITARLPARPAALSGARFGKIW